MSWPPSRLPGGREGSPHCSSKYDGETWGDLNSGRGSSRGQMAGDRRAEPTPWLTCAHTHTHTGPVPWTRVRGGSENSSLPARPSLGQGPELTPCPILPGAEVWLILGTSGQHKLFPSPGTGSAGQPQRGRS